MKKVLLLAAILLSTITIAQEKITEGVIITKQTMSSPDEQTNMQLAMMGEMVTTTYFKGDKSRTELSNPMTGEVITLSDKAEKKMLTLMNNPMYGKKYKMDSLDKGLEDEKKANENAEVTETNEIKEFLGYKCKKYVVKTKVQGADATSIIYATDAISNFDTKKTFGGKIKGMPLYAEVTVKQMGIDIVVKSEVTEIKKDSVADDKFDMTVPEGYEKADASMGF